MQHPPGAEPGEHLRRTIESQPALAEQILADPHPVAGVARALHEAGRIFLAGTGTSYHGAQVGEHLLRSAGLDARAFPAFEFAQYPPEPEPDDALVAMSHRGVKQFTEAALRDFRGRSSRWAVITGQGSPLTGGQVLSTSPQEISSVHTASHTGAMLRLAQLTVALARTLERSVPFWEHLLPTLHQAMAAAVAAKDKCEEVVDAMDLSKPVHFVGGGPAWATANEGALKLREAAHVQAEGHHLENFLHGPLISVEAGQTVFLVIEPGPGLDRAIEIGNALHGIRVNLVVVGSAAEQVDGADFDLTVHRLPEVLAPIVNVVPLQWIAYLAAQRREVNADIFREDDPPYKHALAQLKL